MDPRESNPELGKVILEVVENQIRENDPPETRRTIERLVAEGYGEEAVLLGAQGAARITATAIADVCETIAYDILCGVSDRVPRRYTGSGG